MTCCANLVTYRVSSQKVQSFLNRLAQHGSCHCFIVRAGELASRGGSLTVDSPNVLDILCKVDWKAPSAVVCSQLPACSLTKCTCACSMFTCVGGTWCHMHHLFPVTSSLTLPGACCGLIGQPTSLSGQWLNSTVCQHNQGEVTAITSTVAHNTSQASLSCGISIHGFQRGKRQNPCHHK